MSTTQTPPLPRAARALAGATLFASASPLARERLLAGAVERRLPRGAALFAPGSPAAGVALVLEGRLSCAVVDATRERWVRRVVASGEICGLPSVLDAGPLPCAVTAIAPSTVLLVPAEALRRELLRDAALALRAGQLVARELRRVTAMCGAIASHTPLQRVARHLLEKAQGTATAEAIDTQEQIAAQIGTVREVVGRALRALERRGLIRRHGRSVSLLAPDALRDVAAWTAMDDAVLLPA